MDALEQGLLKLEYLALVWDNTSMGMCLFDDQGRFLLANNAFCRYLGYSLEELRDSNFIDMLHPDDFKSTMRVWNKFLTTREYSYKDELFTNRYRHKDGHWVRFFWLPTTGTLPNGYCTAECLTEDFR